MGERGINCAHSPHIPRLLRPDSVIKPPREGERSMWAGKIRAWTEACEWQAQACGGIPSRTCVGRISSPRGPCSRLRETELSEVSAHKQSRPLRIGS